MDLLVKKIVGISNFLYENPKNTFPGPATNLQNYQVSECILWIRIFQISKINKIKNFKLNTLLLHFVF